MSASVAAASTSSPETLRLAARLNSMIREPSVIMTCGISDDWGVSDLAIELGRCFALMRGGTVLAADFSFSTAQRPGFAAATGRAGMWEALAGARTLEEVEVSDAVPGLQLIGAGNELASPNPLLGPDLSVLAEGLRSRYRVAFLAVDPLLVGPTGLRVARTSDGVVLAAAAGLARHDELSASVDLLEQIEATVLGCVLVGR